jgi:hypothetical protein
MRNGVPFARPTLARRTSETASSSSPHKADYPTPTASPYGKSGNARGHEERRRESLDTMAANWSTPTAHDGSSTGNKPRPRQGGASLRTQVERGVPQLAAPIFEPKKQRWPTATATDAADSGAAGYSTSSGRHSGTTLTDAARLHAGHLGAVTLTAGPDGLVLSPEFVEALMGLPEGWTLVDDEHASAALETPSSPRKRPRRSLSSGKG